MRPAYWQTLEKCSFERFNFLRSCTDLPQKNAAVITHGEQWEKQKQLKETPPMIFSIPLLCVSLSVFNISMSFHPVAPVSQLYQLQLWANDQNHLYFKLKTSFLHKPRLWSYFSFLPNADQEQPNVEMCPCVHKFRKKCSWRNTTDDITWCFPCNV